MSVLRSTGVASFAMVLGCAVERAATTVPQAVEIASPPPVVTRVPDLDVEDSVARPTESVPAVAQPPLPECPRSSDATEGACGAESVCGAGTSGPCRTREPRI